MVDIRENIFTMLNRKVPTKYLDLGSFTILVRIDNIRLEKTMLNLEASINLKPYNIYDSLNLGPIKETSVYNLLT